MRIPTLTLLLLLLGRAATAPAAEVEARLRDAAARIDYGWFTEDLGLITAARDSLQTRPSDPWTSYLHAYASYRAAQLAQARGRPAAAFLDDCRTSAGAVAGDAEAEAEAAVLIAACAALAAAAEPLRAVLHQRRQRQALARAGALEPNNPRLWLVAFLHAGDDPAAPAPDAMLDAFRARDGAFGFPDWGQAEALTAVGARRLESGDLRGARDLLEEALLIAPDYRTALELRRRISSQAAGR